jgi:nicotinamide phosphoribosyltransferase
MRNFILATDSYKHSHFRQYPPEAKRISAYVESRTNSFSDSLVFFGLQAFLMEYLSQPITSADVAEADAVCTAHGIPFNKSGWQAIVEDHKGFLPIEIRALPEGTVVPTSVPLVQVENTDDRMPWLTTFIETALLRGIWYPTTVATLSGKAKQVIHTGLVKSSDDPMGQLPFKLHDFGARGVSSAESAALGGLGHLVSFQGTDTMEALMAARRYYDADMAGFSIPAAEHSTMTSWGRAREEAAYANMLDAFKAEGKIVAVVSDSYDLDNAISNIWGGTLKEKILGEGGTLVVRPDSGDPVETPVRALKILWEKFGGSVNGKGFRVLDPHVRLIQGDGMNIDSIARLVARVIESGFAIDNIAFGMGGGLLQLVNRDSLRFAMKANAMQDTQGIWHDVSKTPATDPTKGSKAGRQAVVLEGGRLVARRMDGVTEDENQLSPVWRAGTLLRKDSLATIRTRAESALLA